MQLWEGMQLRRSLLARAAFVGALLAATAVMFTPNQYRSTAKLMPPEQSALSSVSALTPVTGQLPAVAAGGLLNSKTPGAVSVGILGSRTVQDDLIRRFDLRSVYYRKLYDSTRKILAKRTRIEEDRKNGIINIEVTDTDPYLAREIARAYIEDLNQLLSRLSSSSARKEREFLEVRLAAEQRSLDMDTRMLSQFSSRNATLDYQKQGQTTLEAAGKLQGEMISAESELSSLRTVYTDENVQVRTVQAKIARLRAALQQVTGQGQTSEDTLSASEAFPSIRQLPLLGATYSELLRKVTTDEALYAQLQKQYELARVQEAKEIPAIKVLDEPDLAEKKVYPPRVLFTLLGAFAGMLAAAAWVAWGVLRRQRVYSSFAAPVDAGAPAQENVTARHSG